jgi:hypothetical protein
MPFVNVQGFDLHEKPRLVNVAHIVSVQGESLVLSTGGTIRLSAETVLRLHALLPKLEA